MIPGVAQLDPVPLAAPAAVFWFLLVLTFTLHLLPMSTVLGGSIIAAVSRSRAARGHAHHAELARIVGKLLPVFIAAAVTLGVAALLFLQVLYGRVFFSSSVVMAWFWLAVVPLLIVAYYSAYGLAFEARRSARTGLSWIVALVFATIALIYTNNMTLMLRPDTQHALYAESARGLQLNLADRTLAPRYLHMLAGAIGIAGLAVALIGLVRRRADRPFGDWTMTYGCRWFVASTIVNVGIGVWFLAALPAGLAQRFMGGDAYATGVLALGLVAAVAAILFARSVSGSKRPARPLMAAWGAAVATLALMVLTRDTVRATLLAGAGLQPAAWVQPQWGPIAIFAILLVLAIVLVAWMVTALVCAPVAPVEGTKTAQIQVG